MQNQKIVRKQSEEQASTRRKCILIVDDSIDQLEVNKAILEIDDYETVTAVSGYEALSLIPKMNELDLILLDMQMENMSGLEFLLKLEEQQPEVLKTVPVVFLSGMDEIPECKAVGFIRKPFDFDKFLVAIHQFIEMGPVQRPYKH